MPTGYTDIIDRGVEAGKPPTFEEFVWRCARAFGALVMMRDDPLDTKIPDELQPTPYYLERVASCKAALAAAEAMTLADAEAAMASEIARVNADNERRVAEHVAIRAAYDAMRDKAAAWVPPSGEHTGLRRFMLEQLETGGPYSEPYQEKRPVEPASAWLASRIREAKEELRRARQSLDEEEARVRSRNKWITALRESVPMPVKP